MLIRVNIYNKFTATYLAVILTKRDHISVDMPGQSNILRVQIIHLHFLSQCVFSFFFSN